MKTRIFIFAAIAYAVVSFAATVGCVNNSNASSVNAAGDTLVLCLCDTLHGVNWTDSITGTPNPDPSVNVGGGYWTRTYDGTATTLRFEDFVLTHSSTGSSSGGTMGYWDGFTTGSNGDITDYGSPDTTGHVGSVNWVNNQWGVMAGHGLDTCDYATKAPYLIAYWGYYTEPATHTLQINLADNSLFAPQEIYICNHPWPYYGNIHGDGFARPFHEGDHFYLFIHAVKDDGRKDSVRVNLAVYNRAGLIQSPDWQQISLKDLFAGDNDSIKSLYFTMESTDELIIGDKNYGPNTAVYFNMDKLKVVKQGTAPASATTVSQKAPTITASSKGIEVTDIFPVPSYTGGDVIIYDKHGKNAVLQTTVKAGEKINLSKLPKGEYRLRHGHKHIPITKK